MEVQLNKRLAGLREELDFGRQQLAELDVSREELQEMLLRISGAIQVLEEELEKCAGEQQEEKTAVKAA